MFQYSPAGCKDKAHGPILKELMQTKNFRVTVVEESDVVEICGALKVYIFIYILLVFIFIYLSYVLLRFSQANMNP